jgi:hypothetical protein
VVAGLQQNQVVVTDDVSEPVFIIDPARHAAADAILSWFRFANAVDEHWPVTGTSRQFPARPRYR